MGKLFTKAPKACLIQSPSYDAKKPEATAFDVGRTSPRRGLQSTVVAPRVTALLPMVSVSHSQLQSENIKQGILERNTSHVEMSCCLRSLVTCGARPGREPPWCSSTSTSHPPVGQSLCHMDGDGSAALVFRSPRFCLIM